LPIASARANYEYMSLDAGVAGTVDESLNKVWRVFGRIGQANAAVYTLKEPATNLRGRTIVVELLHRDSGGGMNLGCFRVSIAGHRNSFDVLQPWEGVTSSELVTLNRELAKAHAQQGHTNEAIASLSEAFQLAVGRSEQA